MPRPRPLRKLATPTFLAKARDRRGRTLGAWPLEIQANSLGDNLDQGAEEVQQTHSSSAFLHNGCVFKVKAGLAGLLGL
jgi:hypothetical protein